jgi:hypothetical protein
MQGTCLSLNSLARINTSLHRSPKNPSSISIAQQQKISHHFRAGKLLRIMIRFTPKRLQFLRCQVLNISVFDSSNNQAARQPMWLINQS